MSEHIQLRIAVEDAQRHLDECNALRQETVALRERVAELEAVLLGEEQTRDAYHDDLARLRAEREALS